MQKTLRIRAATLVSGIVNPFVSAILALVVLATRSALSFMETVRWSLLVVSIGLAPVLLLSLVMARQGKIRGIFASGRRQRTVIYALAAGVAALDYAVIRSLGAPAIFTTAVSTGLMAVIAYATINLWWKISVHSAFTSGVVTCLVAFYGWAGLLAAPVVALVCWARVALGEHSIAQVTAGAALAAAITTLGLKLGGML